MTAAHTRVVQAGDDGEMFAEVLKQSKILRRCVTGTRLFRDEGIAVNAQWQTDEQKTAGLFPGLRGMGDATERFEPGQAQSDANAAQKVAAGGECGLRVLGAA